jgi:hypothetical protein
MSGIWLVSGKMIQCSKPVTQERRLLLRVVGCPPAQARGASPIRSRAGVVQAPMEETAGPEAARGQAKSL